MSNVKPLRTRDLTPQMVLDSVQEQADNYEHIFIVALRKDGDTESWTTQMNTAEFALVSLITTDFAHRILNEEVVFAD